MARDLARDLASDSESFETNDSTRADVRRHLGWSRVVDAIADALRSPAARAQSLPEDRAPWFVPASGLQDARRRFLALRAIEVVQRCADEAGDRRLPGILRDVHRLGDALEHARGGGTLGVADLAVARDSLRAARAWVAGCRRARASDDAEGPLDALSEQLGWSGGRDNEFEEEDEALLEVLERSIELDPMEGEPVLADAASPELAKARRKARGSEGARRDTVARVLKRAAVRTALRDEFATEREGRSVIPLRSDSLGEVRAATGPLVVHGSTARGATFFVETPALVDANNAVREAAAAVAVEEERVLRLLANRVGARADTLSRYERVLVALDQTWACLDVCRQWEGLEPKLAQGETLELEGLRHPWMLLDGADVVANDVHLDRGRALVVSGPNAGGKTVLLKSLGLCVMLAAHGMRLPTAVPAHLPWFTRIRSHIGDDQSIAASLSTFSAQLTHLAAALEVAREDGEGLLVLLDEVAVGTEPTQGAALAEATLIALVERGATVVATTHYDRLKRLAVRSEGPGAGRFVNASVGFDLDAMRPTFRLVIGTPGTSGALALAERLGYDEEVLREATGLLDERARDVDALLRDVEGRRTELERERERLDHERDELAQRKGALERREAAVEAGVKSERAQAWAAASEALFALESELKVRRRELRRAGRDPEKIGTRGELTRDARTALEEHRAPAEPVEPRAPAPKAGDVVSVDGMRGEVVSLKGAKVTVLVGSMRRTVDVAKLGAGPPEPKPPPKRAKWSGALATPKSTASRHFGQSPSPFVSSVDTSVDVRGLRVDECTELLERFLSDVLARGDDVVVVRHGIGSGALRRVVRERLARLAHVRRHRPGLTDEGGEAVTVVWIG